MKFFKLAAVAAALAGAALSASAMTAMQDNQLSSVTGQDGVTIAANLNINLGSFQYTNTKDGTGASASVAFNNIHVAGLMLMTVDVISSAEFKAELGTALAGAPAGTAAAVDAELAANTSIGYNGTDMVKFAFPALDALNANGTLANPATSVAHGLSPTITVGSVTMGNGGGKSFGSFTLQNLDLQGTSVYMWAH